MRQRAAAAAAAMGDVFAAATARRRFDRGDDHLATAGRAWDDESRQRSGTGRDGVASHGRSFPVVCPFPLPRACPPLVAVGRLSFWSLLLLLKRRAADPALACRKPDSLSRFRQAGILSNRHDHTAQQYFWMPAATKWRAAASRPLPMPTCERPTLRPTKRERRRPNKQKDDPLHVVMLGLRRELTNRHVFDHAPARRAYGLVGHGRCSCLE